MVLIRPTSSQPHVIATGPPCSKAIVYEVRHPARIEMIVNEMAKLLEPSLRAEELLRVAQLVEDLLVLRGVVSGASDQCSYVLPGIADGVEAGITCTRASDMSTDPVSDTMRDGVLGSRPC